MRCAAPGRGGWVILVAFDLPERNGVVLRKQPQLERKRQLAKLIWRGAKTGPKTWSAIRYGDHMVGDGPTIFDHVCRLGLEDIVSKRTDAPYRSGPSKVWLKTKNSESAAVRRERGEEWR